MKPIKVIVAFAVLAALALIAYPLYAHCGKCAADGKTIATQLDQNKMTLAKAVTADETHSKGKAITVISELNKDDKLALEVYCIVGDPAKIMMCNVDGVTGTVTTSKEVKQFPITEADDSHDHAKPKEGTGAAGGGGGGVGGEPKMITNQTVEVACGACVYKMAGATGCPLAVMIDGRPYLLTGATWPNHDYCTAKQQAVVSGKLEGDKFIATSVKPKT